jgi:hypothetical protein
VSANVDVPGHGRRTGGVLRPAEDGRVDGHSVLCQRPKARAAFVRLVKAGVDGEVPVVAP